MKSFNTFFARRLAIWPTLSPNVHFRTPSDWRPFPLNQENCKIFSRARHAIWSASQAMGLQEGDTVLVPAYHHGSEIESLLKAGFQVSYYEVNESLEPDPKELDALIKTGVKALYLIHYLGFSQNAAYWRQWCDERHLFLIEDAAQAFLTLRDGQPVGSFGHIGVFCLYKTYGIPDGGAVFSAFPLNQPTASPRTGIWRMLKRHGNWIAARRGIFGLMHFLVKPALAWWKGLYEHPHAEFDLGDPSTPPSLMTIYLLHKVLDERAAERRRYNYRFLLKYLGDLVPAPFSSLPEGACPFAFPIEMSEPKAFLDRLRDWGILGLLFWINPHPSLPVDEFPRSRLMRERVLALPVHQELTETDLINIVDAVNNCRVNRTSTVASAS